LLKFVVGRFSRFLRGGYNYCLEHTIYGHNGSGRRIMLTVGEWKALKRCLRRVRRVRVRMKRRIRWSRPAAAALQLQLDALREQIATLTRKRDAKIEQS
ncbi:MAG: hypothetical protein DRP01_09435, partial [Archaeoglobales archaeon]